MTHNHWYHVPSFLTPKECEKLIKYAVKTYPAKPAVVGHGGQARVDNVLRRSTVRWLDYADLELFWFFRRIERELLRAQSAFGYDLQHSSTEWQLTEYDSADRQLYDWHQDSSEQCKDAYERKLTLVLQLTPPEKYQGGQFELKGDKLPGTHFKNAGDLLFFRSALWHRATEVTAGKRYSLVSWIKGPRR